MKGSIRTPKLEAAGCSDFLFLEVQILPVLLLDVSHLFAHAHVVGLGALVGGAADPRVTALHHRQTACTSTYIEQLVLLNINQCLFVLFRSIWKDKFNLQNPAISILRNQQ